MARWFPNRRGSPAQPDIDRAVVDAALRAVATLVDEESAFRAAGRAAAQQLGPGSIPALARRFHDPPDAPEGWGNEERGLGAWLEAWQLAIFETFYCCGEEAYPVVHSSAYGDYDWTQANAIEVLCRLAADDVRRDEILNEFRANFPEVRWEAQVNAVGLLLRQAADRPALARVLDELVDVESYGDAVAYWSGQES
ncbi:MAG: hypothetical protein DHS20C19_10370 [Acidimicrobiales bacterium]|nr:MAG: hypothetical protein DHS20C19_10370 [Acidimicrobiales bacterium]